MRAAEIVPLDASGILPKSCWNATKLRRNGQLSIFELPREAQQLSARDISTIPGADRSPKNWHGGRQVHVPLELAQAGEDRKIAPAGLRLFFELLTAVPYRARKREDHEVRIDVASLAACLWPGGHYRPSRHGPALRHALTVAHNCRLPVWSPETRTGYFAPVNIRIMPDVTDPLSMMVATVSFILREAAGPLINRRLLRRYGAESALTWRLLLSLTWLWDLYLSGRRAPGMRALPCLQPLDVIELAYGHRPAFSSRERKHRARKRAWSAVGRLFEDQQVEVESGEDGLKLLPGPAWHQLQEWAKQARNGDAQILGMGR